MSGAERLVFHVVGFVVVAAVVFFSGLPLLPAAVLGILAEIVVLIGLGRILMRIEFGDWR